MIHGFAVALSPNIASAATAIRVPVRELHVNPWDTGTKGLPAFNLGNSNVTGTGTTLGLTLALVRSPFAAMQQAPTELILGSTDGTMLINMTDEFGISTAATTVFTGFGID